MKKLVRKNYSQQQSLHGYYYACTCLCAVCKCTFLHVGSGDSASNGINVDNATSTAENTHC